MNKEKKEIPETNTPEVKKEVKKDDKKKNSSAWVFIILTLLILVEIGGSVFLIVKLPKKAGEIQKLRTQNLAYQMTNQDELLLLQDLEETKADREKLMSVFPNESNLLDFIEIVDGIRDSKVEVIKFSVDSDVPTKIGKAQSFLPMTLILKGEEKEVDAALSKIVRSKFFIKTISFTKEFNNEGDQVIVSTQFHLFVSDEFSKTKS